jgi:hypothetical protein
VFAILAAADPSIAHIQQNHNGAVFWFPPHRAAPSQKLRALPQDAVTQISHLGFEAGIARAAIHAATAFIRERDAASAASLGSPSGAPSIASAALGTIPT